MGEAWSVAEGERGMRLDVFVVRRLTGASRARVRALVAAGEVLVNGRPGVAGQTVLPGARVELTAEPEPEDFDPLPDPDVALAWVLVDDVVVVVDKPAGVPSHPHRVDERGAVANALVARFPEIVGVGYRRREAGLVHRLDTGTSGLVLSARTRDAFVRLVADLRAGRIEKRYVAACVGHVRAPQTIDTALETDPSDPRRVRAARAATGRGARGTRQTAEGARRTTEVVSARHGGGRSVVELSVHRAGRHQIRAHLASLGHALLGDELYGGPGSVEGRHLLHASAIGFVHPVSGERIVVRSTVPAELHGVLDRLRRGA